MRPRSSTRVFSPFSVSSFAAQPPLIPEPTTIASNEFDSMFYSRTHWKRWHRGIMDHLRVLLVPFSPTCLILIGIVSVLLTFFASAGLLFGALGIFILQVWMFKYCYVLIEHIANGQPEPPVLSTDMLSPFEI